MKDNEKREKVTNEIMATDNEFKGYTIEEIRFQRAMVAMQADFCKTRFMKSLCNIQKVNPLNPSSGSSLPVKAGSLALKMVKGLNYMDYLLLGISVFNGVKKFYSFFRKGKKLKS